MMVVVWDRADDLRKDQERLVELGLRDAPDPRAMMEVEIFEGLWQLLDNLAPHRDEIRNMIARRKAAERKGSK